MTTIYRSPNKIIDGIIWHVTVEQNRCGRRIIMYRWRENERVMWSPACKYPRRLPKGLARFFKNYRRSIQDALTWDKVAA